MNLQQLPRTAPATVLACGAYLKNRACLLDGDRVHWSELHGDLSDASACSALADSIEALLERATAPLQAVAHDLHPDFQSTRQALALARRLGVPAVAVQHHHAHIAVARAEHGVDVPVIGIALDGVGLGSDGSAWGGELLWVGEGSRWCRIDHLAPLALPGGDAAAREPWRLAAAVMHAAGRGEEIVPRFAPQVGEPAARLLQAMLQRGLNCPRGSAAGRWFDAAAAALGLSTRQTEGAEAAIALERAAARWLDAHPGFEFRWPSLDLQPLLLQLLALPADDADAVARGAAMFHLGLASALAQRALSAAAEAAVDTVVLAGGCFANRILAGQLQRELQRAGLRVLQPQTAGCGDAGLALGQAWVAAAACRASASPVALETEA
jgi:hydrogenase maturation protein HypF